jgi:hypothetical protein
MPRNALEERLEAITREFVAQIVSTLRSASFGDVAGLETPRGARPAPAGGPRSRPQTRVSASPSATWAEHAEGHKRQTADVRAELAERVVKALEAAHDSLGVRALSSELGIAPDLLAAPLKELRAAGRIAKHGEKRATTYSIA